jgi:hypothetical protein
MERKKTAVEVFQRSVSCGMDGVNEQGDSQKIYIKADTVDTEYIL